MIFDIENWLWKSDWGNSWQPMWTFVKVETKISFSFTDIFTKITSAKLLHWGHTKYIIYKQFILQVNLFQSMIKMSSGNKQARS